MGVDAIAAIRAVFLDRDGVLNRAAIGADGIPRPPQRLEDLEVLPGVSDACVLLRQLCFELIVVTNQPDVVRGLQKRHVVEAINDRLKAELGLRDFRTCYHDDADRCSCRKPAPGLLLQAARDRGIDLTRSYAIGDRWRDIEAGRRAGCFTILIDSGSREPLHSAPDLRVGSLLEAARWIEKRLGWAAGTTSERP